MDICRLDSPVLPLRRVATASTAVREEAFMASTLRMFGTDASDFPEVHAACADNIDFMSRLGDETMQLIVTSPPYNIGKDYETRNSLDAYLDSQRRVIEECVRLLRPTGSIYVRIHLLFL